MKKAVEMREFISDYHLGFHWFLLIGKWLTKKHFKIIEDELLEGEEVHISFMARFQSAESIVNADGKEDTRMLKWQKTKGYYVFGLTSFNRLIYAHWHPFRYITRSIKFDALTDVRISTNLLMGHLRVGTLEEDFYIYYFSPKIKEIGKILQFAFIEKTVPMIYDNEDDFELECDEYSDADYEENEVEAEYEYETYDQEDDSEFETDNYYECPDGEVESEYYEYESESNSENEPEEYYEDEEDVEYEYDHKK